MSKNSKETWETQGDTLLATHFFSEERVDVVGCYDEDTPLGTYEFYDLYWDGTCINEGNPIYDKMPSSEFVKEYLELYINEFTDKEIEKLEKTGAKPIIVKSLVATPEEIRNFELNYMQ